MTEKMQKNKCTDRISIYVIRVVKIKRIISYIYIYVYTSLSRGSQKTQYIQEGHATNERNARQAIIIPNYRGRGAEAVGYNDTEHAERQRENVERGRRDAWKVSGLLAAVLRAELPMYT